MKRIIQILLIIPLFIFSCIKPEKYPDTPSIKYESFELKDTIDDLDNHIKIGTLTFSFIDGNGDIGLRDEDTIAPYDTLSIYYYNLYIKMFKKQNGAYIPVDLLIPLNYRIPYYVATGQNKTLKGKIKIDITYNPIPYDTIKYQFYMYDRALNKSNTESTPDIILNN